MPLKGLASATQPEPRALGGPANLPVRQVAAVVMGSALEFYDFGTYSYFALQIGRTFFPTQNPLSSLLLSLATFGVGFLARPAGAVVVGRFADRTVQSQCQLDQRLGNKVRAAPPTRGPISRARAAPNSD